MRLLFIQLLTIFFFSIPAAFIQTALPQNHYRKRFYFIQINLSKTIHRFVAADNIQKNKPPAFSVRRFRIMFYKGTVQQHCCIAGLIHSDPGTIGCRIFWIQKCSNIISIHSRYMRFRPYRFFIPAGSNETTVFLWYECYCTHELRYLIVEDAIPKLSSTASTASSLIPIRISAM